MSEVLSESVIREASGEAGIKQLDPKPMTGIKELDSAELWKAIRKLSDANTMNVVLLLFDRPMLFGELQKATGLPTNGLNHILQEMKRMDLVIQSKSDRRYHLTNYCVVILDTLRHLTESLASVDERVMFSPSK